jgi:hypothetical protein
MIWSYVSEEYSGDFFGVYVNGILVVQGKEILVEDLFEYCRKNEVEFSKTDEIEYFSYDLNNDPLNDGFPDKFSDLDLKLLQNLNRSGAR